MHAILEFFGLLKLLSLLFTRNGGGGDVGPTPFAPSPATPTGPAPFTPPRKMPPPGARDFPQVVWPSTPPATLPVFPGGWEYDEPPPAEVQARASVLLPILWGQGAGSKRTEMVGGRWITFVAEVVRGGSRGVTAWRIKQGARPSPGGAPPTTYAPATPGAPSAAPAPVPAAAPVAPPAAQPAVYTSPASAPQGPPVVTNQDVQHALNALGWQPPLIVDGKIGPLSVAAIRAFQAKPHPPLAPLAVDGIAGPLTKAALSYVLGQTMSA